MPARVTRAEHDQALDEIESLRSELAEIRRSSASWVDGVLRKRIIVHTKDGQTIDGLISVEQPADGFALKAPKLINADGSATQMAGEVYVPSANVAFAQLDE